MEAFRAALAKKERKEFDDMWDIPRLYITACSNSVSLVPLHPIMMSILFHRYKELMECMAEVEMMMMTISPRRLQDVNEGEGIVDPLPEAPQQQQARLLDFL